MLECDRLTMTDGQTGDRVNKKCENWTWPIVNNQWCNQVFQDQDQDFNFKPKTKIKTLKFFQDQEQDVFVM